MSADDIRNDCRTMLTDESYAQIMLGSQDILDIAEDVHTRYEFYKQLKLNDENEAIFFRAMEISKIYEDDAEVFWEYMQDKAFHIWGELICAIPKVFDLECCIDDLEDFVIRTQMHCPFAEAFYESTYLNENAKEDEDSKLFYVFTTDMSWD